MNVGATVKRLAAAVTGERAQRQKPAKTATNGVLEAAQRVAARRRALYGERGRLIGLRDEERRKAESLGKQLQELETARLDALTEHRIGGNDAAGTKAADLLTQAATIRQQITDAEGLSERADERIAALDPELALVKEQYRQAQGEMLDELYRRAAADYHLHAQRTGALVVRIAALHRTMMKLLAGNSNGWDGSLYLPDITPGDGNLRAPLFQTGTRAFDAAANACVEEILTELREAGLG